MDTMIKSGYSFERGDAVWYNDEAERRYICQAGELLAVAFNDGTREILTHGSYNHAAGWLVGRNRKARSAGDMLYGVVNKIIAFHATPQGLEILNDVNEKRCGVDTLEARVSAINDLDPAPVG
jgi:hypothetical protein